MSSIVVRMVGIYYPSLLELVLCFLQSTRNVGERKPTDRVSTRTKLITNFQHMCYWLNMLFFAGWCSGLPWLVNWQLFTGHLQRRSFLLVIPSSFLSFSLKEVKGCVSFLSRVILSTDDWSEGGIPWNYLDKRTEVRQFVEKEVHYIHLSLRLCGSAFS